MVTTARYGTLAGIDFTDMATPRLLMTLRLSIRRFPNSLALQFVALL